MSEPGEQPLLVLTRRDLESLLSPPALMDALEAAFRGYAAGHVIVPARTVVPSGEDGALLVMPASWRAVGGAAGALGTKLVTFYPGNRARGHPTHLASYLLLDAATGAPLALLEGTWLTSLRTGATSAVAARRLARPESVAVACFGTSVQARSQLRCLAAAFSLRRITVMGRDPDRARQFARTMADELRVETTVAGDPRAAVAGADIVTCATTSPTPLFDGATLRPGTHVDAVGAFRPDTRELDTETLRRSTVVVETYAGVLAEAGDLLLPMKEGAIDRADVAAELGDLVTGRHPGRRTADEITVFKSVGFALEDLATAQLAYRLARERGVGTEVGL